MENSTEWSKDLPMDKPFDSLELLTHLDSDEQATMFFQSTILNLSHQQIADYHKNKYSRVTVTRMIQRAKKRLAQLYHEKKISFYYNSNL
jgi:DNA-directed RNA polymerase specialized sigma24 family protein